MKNIIARLRATTWKQRIAVIILVIVLLAGAVWYFNQDSDNGYTFDTVQAHDITERISESGSVIIAGATAIYSPTHGVIEEIYVQNGDLVGLDDPLFKVVSTATEDEKLAAAATLTAKKSALKTAEQTKLTRQAALEVARQSVLDKQQAVTDKNTTRSESNIDPSTGEEYTQNEIDSIDSELTSARYSFNAAEKQYVEADVAIQAAQAALAEASLAFESTKDRIVKSTTIGTVSNLSIAVGGTILASTADALVQRTPAMRVANFSSNEVILELNETDISKIKVGQSATIEPDANRNLVYDGVVSRVDDIAHDKDGVVVYNVYIDIFDLDTQLKSGMTVDVEIETSSKEQVISVPNSAVKPYQGGRAVRVLNRVTGELEFIPVIIGIRGEEYTEIVEGVEPGTEIVVSISNDNIEREGGFGF